MPNYSENEIDIINRHLRAMTRLLLGNKTMEPGLTIVAGGPVGECNKSGLARLAGASGRDLVYLSFDRTTDGFGMVSIAVCLPRDFAVHLSLDCSLSLMGKYAIITPPEHVLGHFMITPGEIIHKPGKPYGWKHCVNPAAQRLRELVELDLDTSSQVALDTIEPTV